MLFGFILSARYVVAKQYHLASFLTRNSMLNTLLRKPITTQDFIQLCNSIEYRTSHLNVLSIHMILLVSVYTKKVQVIRRIFHGITPESIA